MPFSYVVYKKHRLVVSTGTGRVTYDEIKARQDQTKGDPDFNSDFNQIVDLRTATTVYLTVDQARELASRNIFSPTSLRAFIATTPAVFGMGRMWESYTENSTKDIPNTYFLEPSFGHRLARAEGQGGSSLNSGLGTPPRTALCLSVSLKNVLERRLSNPTKRLVGGPRS